MAAIPQTIESEVIVVDEGDGVFFRGADGLGPSGGLPVVFAVVIRNPWGKRLAEMHSQSVDVGLIHVAEFEEFLLGFVSFGEGHAVLGELDAHFVQDFWRQAVGFRRTGRGAEDLAEISDRVARNGEGKLGLLGAGAFNAGDGEGASVQDGG